LQPQLGSQAQVCSQQQLGSQAQVCSQQQLGSQQLLRQLNRPLRPLNKQQRRGAQHEPQESQPQLGSQQQLGSQAQVCSQQQLGSQQLFWPHRQPKKALALPAVLRTIATLSAAKVTQLFMGGLLK